LARHARFTVRTVQPLQYPPYATPSNDARLPSSSKGRLAFQMAYLAANRLQIIRENGLAASRPKVAHAESVAMGSILARSKWLALRPRRGELKASAGSPLLESEGERRIGAFALRGLGAVRPSVRSARGSEAVRSALAALRTDQKGGPTGFGAGGEGRLVQGARCFASRIGRPDRRRWLVSSSGQSRGCARRPAQGPGSTALRFASTQETTLA
jgi:hypothetical protein